MSLKPEQGDTKVAVPVTFDVRSRTLQLKMSKIYISLAILAFTFIGWLVIMIISATNDFRIIASIIAFIIVPLVCRFGIIGEHKFRDNFELLREHNYYYTYDLFWNIYDTQLVNNNITAFLHTTGTVSVFVALDKDVVVGKQDYSGFSHYEAISDAYNILAKKEITCFHIDYMDAVGEDPRLENLYANADKCKSADLKNIMLDMLDYMQWDMSGSFSSYDVYCFSAKLRPDMLVEEILPVVQLLLQGNYVRARYLDRNDIRKLTDTVLNIPDFSVTRTCDSLFSSGRTNHLKIIWTETDNKREIVNKTSRELAEQARIAASEAEARKGIKKKRKTLSNEAIDLFEESEPDETKYFDLFDK